MDEEEKEYDSKTASVYEASKQYSLDDPFVRAFVKTFGSKAEAEAAYVYEQKEKQKNK